MKNSEVEQKLETLLKLKGTIKPGTVLESTGVHPAGRMYGLFGMAVPTKYEVISTKEYVKAEAESPSGLAGVMELIEGLEKNPEIVDEDTVVVFARPLDNGEDFHDGATFVLDVGYHVKAPSNV